MKLNLRTNYLIAIITIIYMVLYGLLLSIRITHWEAMADNYYSIAITLDPLYILLLIYLVNILTALNEKITITTALVIYTGLQMILFMLNLFTSYSFGPVFTTSVGVLKLLLIFYFIYKTFSIQSKYISLGYKLFGFSLVILIAVKSVFAIAFKTIATNGVINFVDIISLLTPLSILFIIKRINTFIRDTSKKPDVAVIE